jgi:hypothetical protein
LEGNTFDYEGAEIMKKTLITIAITTVVVLALVGIVSGRQVNNTFATISAPLPVEYGMGGGGGSDLYYAEAPAAAPMEQSVNRAVSVEMAANQTSVDVNRLVIKNADLAIVVKDPKADMERISKLANELGGYVVSSNLYQSYYGPNSIEVPEATVSIRVPVEKLDEALGKIKEDAAEVTYENTSGVDVTSEYVDLTSRLKAKEAAEKKLLEIMEDATATEDVLAVYNQLQLIQTEIEALKGQIKYYEQSAAMSSISIRLIAEEGTQPIEVGGWKIEGTAKEAIQDLVNFLQGFTQFLIRFFLNYIWQILVIALILYVIYRIGRALFRRFMPSQAVVEVKEEEKK